MSSVQNLRHTICTAICIVIDKMMETTKLQTNSLDKKVEIKVAGKDNYSQLVVKENAQ